MLISVDVFLYRCVRSAGYINRAQRTKYGNDMKLRHDNVIKWHFPRYGPFVRGIHRSPVFVPHKDQWRGALMFSLISARINGWVNHREAGELRRIRPQLWRHSNGFAVCWPFYSHSIYGTLVYFVGCVFSSVWLLRSRHDIKLNNISYMLATCLVRITMNLTLLEIDVAVIR